MLKIHMEKFIKAIREILKISLSKLQKLFAKICFKKVKFSWSYLLIGLPLFVALYYFLGAYLMENINADTSVEIKDSSDEQSNTINAMSYIINKETNTNVWTPNMPIIFPAYLLDNMPEFQKGELEATKKVAVVFAKNLKKQIPDSIKELEDAAQYLSYSPTVWLFAENKDKIFAPSSSTQYSKAKRELSIFNQKLSDKEISFFYQVDDLKRILDVVYKDLSATSKNTKQYIRENSQNVFDFSADNLFYYNKGKLYGYYIILRSAGEDYKEVILNANMYPIWSSLLKCLEEGAEISPIVVRNADINSSVSPNHLAYSNMQLLCAIEKIKKLDFSKQEEREIDRDTTNSK